MRPCRGSKKWSALRKVETRSQASLLTRIAPSSACSASTWWGGARKVAVGDGAMERISALDMDQHYPKRPSRLDAHAVNNGERWGSRTGQMRRGGRAPLTFPAITAGGGGCRPQYTRGSQERGHKSFLHADECRLYNELSSTFHPLARKAGENVRGDIHTKPWKRVRKPKHKVVQCWPLR